MVFKNEWSEIPTLPIFSTKWRTQEAKQIFQLLRDEYRTSKRLIVFKRYRELERIIRMFTSEQVLEKMLHLTRKKSEKDAKTYGRKKSSLMYNEPPILEDDGDDDGENNNSVFAEKEDINSSVFYRFVNTLASTIRRSLSQPSQYPVPRGSSILSVRSVPEYMCQGGDTTSYACLSLADNRSIASSPARSPVDPISPTGRSTFTFPSMTHLSSKQESGTLPNTQPGTPKYRRRSRAMGIEQCVIRKGHIPKFQIPPSRKTINSRVRTSSLRTLKTGSTPGSPVVPRVQSDPRMSSFSNVLHHNQNRASQSTFCASQNTFGASQSTLWGSQSTLGASRSGLGPLEFLTVPVSQRVRTSSTGSSTYESPNQSPRLKPRSQHLCMVTPKMYKEEDFFSGGIQRKYAVCAAELEEMNIFFAYERMLQLKNEFESLQGKNALQRYKKMKSMLKTCLEAGF